MVALLLDDVARRDVDLVRALYDRAMVDRAPPHVLLVEPFEEGTSSSALTEMMGLIASVHQPFMLEFGQPEARFEGEQQQLQFVATQGGDASRDLATALYRDVFPHHRPDDPVGTPLERTVMTVGRFDQERDAQQAARALEEKKYYLVVSELGLFEQVEEEGWELLQALTLGSMIEP